MIMERRMMLWLYHVIILQGLQTLVSSALLIEGVTRRDRQAQLEIPKYYFMKRTTAWHTWACVCMSTYVFKDYICID